MVRIREFEEENYRAFFNNGKTLRMLFRAGEPIKPLRFPEIEDVSLGTKCLAGCPFCYTSAIKSGILYSNVVEKVHKVYGSQSLNERPFQVAIGGGGEPTMHPEFIEVLKAFKSLDIMPNYTTNGMHLTPEILEATKELCGGVAVSCHPHINKVWRTAVQRYIDSGIRTSLHIIVGESGSNQRFWDIFDSIKDIDYFVALPYQIYGRAAETKIKQAYIEDEWGYFFRECQKRGVGEKISNISFGALFYPFFEEYPKIPESLNISLYEPEVLSGYRMLDDDYTLLRKSSYDLSPKFPVQELAHE